MRHAASLPALAASLALLAACGGGRSTPPGPPPIDPGNPADLLFQSGVTRYDAATLAQTDAFAARKAGDAAAEASRFATSRAEFGQAQGIFDQLASLYPQSIRRDNAAYLAGRCSYENGTIDQVKADDSKLAADQATATASFTEARSRLAPFAATWPASSFGHPAAYVLGRARFYLADAAPAQDSFAAARNEFARALALQPAGTFADNAQYYLGRSWFEDGYRLVNVVPGPALGSPNWVAAKDDLQHAEVELARLVSAFPASTYLDNALYYQGKAWFEEPVDTSATPVPATDSKAKRVANVDKAIALFGQVIGTPASPYVGGARYWRAKAWYSRAFLAAAGGVKNQADLAAAIADLGTVRPPAIYADNALYYLAKCYVHVDPGPACLPAAAVGPPPTTACGAVAALDALVAADPAYAASTYPGLARAYATTNGCICP